MRTWVGNLGILPSMRPPPPARVSGVGHSLGGSAVDFLLFACSGGPGTEWPADDKVSSLFDFP